METVCVLCVRSDGFYQDACPYAVKAALAACKVAKQHEGRICLVDMAAFNATVEPMLEGSVDVARAYCKAVEYLTGFAGANSYNRANSGAASDLVLLAMTSHGCDDYVQRRGADALGCLARGNPVNIARILAMDGIDTLFAAADAHVASRHVQESVCWALFYIARYSSHGRAMLRASRVVEVATRAKASHPIPHDSDIDWVDRLLRSLVE